jgi:pyroglutamyl-peptidase
MLLLTAFEPFDSTGINSSLEVLNEFMRQYAESLPVASAILPVEYDADFAAAWRAVAEVQPQAIVHLGQTGGRVVAVERIGINLKIAQSQHARILDDAPPACFATVPVDDIIAAMTTADVPVEGSAHAGTFLCNHILFRSLHHAATQGLDVPIGFIHLPRLPEQAEMLGREIPTLPLETMVRGLEAVVRVLMRGGR